jgi:TolB-like protein/Tfp pilus assembly protein PilF/DNA-binding winged helix-turn-helix (wHTH) protein
MQPRRPSRLIHIGAFEVDLEAGELRRNGTQVGLPEQSVWVLEVLLERRGKLVSREELRQKLWPAHSLVDFDQSLQLAVRLLREALGDSAEHPAYVETVPGRGYRFIGKVDSGKPASRLPRLVQHAYSRQVRLGRAVVSFLLVAAVAIAVYRVWPVRSGTGRLAVLPFTVLSGTPEEAYLPRGLHSDLITELGRLNPERLPVFAGTTMRQYENTNKPVDQIARELGAVYVLESSFRREGESIRINVQLIQGANQTQLWAQTYDRKREEIANLPQEVARELAQHLGIGLSAEQRARLAAPHRVHPDAYIAYQKGRYAWDKRTVEGLQQAIVQFRQAIATDPQYAAPHAGLADTYNVMGFYSVLRPAEAYPLAREAAQKALAIDSNAAEAYAALADVSLHYDYDWAAAEENFRRAITLDDNYATAHHWYALLLVLRGRPEESWKELNRALELDPKSLAINADLGLYFFYTRQFDRAIERARKALELDPSYPMAHVWLGRALVEKRRYAEAMAEFQRALQIEPNHLLALALLGHAQGVSGRVAEARAAIQQLAEISKQRFVAPTLTALIYAGLGDADQAVAWGEKAYREHDPLLTRIGAEPLVDNLRSDARFRDLIRRAGGQK